MFDFIKSCSREKTNKFCSSRLLLPACSKIREMCRNILATKMKQVHYVTFIITSLILMVLIYWILSHNILNNSNTRSRKQQVYQLYKFTIMKISLKKAPVERADACSWKDMIVNKPNWRLCYTIFWTFYIPILYCQAEALHSEVNFWQQNQEIRHSWNQNPSFNTAWDISVNLHCLSVLTSIAMLSPHFPDVATVYFIRSFLQQNC